VIGAFEKRNDRPTCAKTSFTRYRVLANQGIVNRYATKGGVVAYQNLPADSSRENGASRVSHFR
jgi:hypothetical protein